MARLQAGTHAALNSLMDRHAAQLFHYLVRSLQDEDDAADLAQETFARVYLNRSKFDASQKFTTWLYAIARNLVRDRYRWRSRHPQVSLDSDNENTEASFRDTLPSHDSGPDEQMQTGERALAVQHAIGKLPEELREPLILSIYESLSQSEIAVILKCSVKAVETRLYRARQRLRESLAELLPSV